MPPTLPPQCAHVQTHTQGELKLTQTKAEQAARKSVASAKVAGEQYTAMAAQLGKVEKQRLASSREADQLKVRRWLRHECSIVTSTWRLSHCSCWSHCCALRRLAAASPS
jgi:head-tail adaptor